MFLLKTLSIFGLLASSAAAAFTVPNDDQDMTGLTVNSIPYSTRVKYMRLVSSLESMYFPKVNIPLRQTKLSTNRVDHVHLPHMELSSSITRQMQSFARVPISEPETQRKTTPILIETKRNLPDIFTAFTARFQRSMPAQPFS